MPVTDKELEEDPDLRQWIEREFPQGAAEFSDPVSRREFLKLMGASIALAGVNACTQPPLEKIVPWVKAPENVIPGEALYYATCLSIEGTARGVLVESHMGRPTKVEGNPRHPDSLGASDVFMQASILELYDPDRSKTLMQRGQISTWASFRQEMTERRQSFSATRGKGLRILTGRLSSPSLEKNMRDLLSRYPEARWHSYEAVGQDNRREGTRLAFGEAVEFHYDLREADTLLSLDSDFLCRGPGGLAYARQFADRRRLRDKAPGMNRLYCVESAFSRIAERRRITGFRSDALKSKALP
jgi:MoCo/4Fe-4S cofactor protein with predicted Tat translocation signal